jgi:hypothetical protein
MKHGIIVGIGTDSSLTSAIDVDVRHTLRISTETDEAELSLRGLARTLAENGIAPTLIAEELFLLATAVFVADTRLRRDDGDDGWTRQIAISLPTSDVDRWNQARAGLERALRFLTGDLWSLEFRRPASSVRLFATEIAEADRAGLARVALFSGGLDSFIGALDLIGNGEPLTLVSHYADGSASVPQDNAFAHVQRCADASQVVSKIQARIVAPGDIFAAGNDDRQRSRSFLFIALGVLVAQAIGAPELIVPENGLISLNVPLNDLRIGSYSTRTTHPHYLALLGTVLRAIGIDVSLRNPYRFKTKGEMLVECAQQDGLMVAAAGTMSCAHPTSSRWRRKGAPALIHCGRCTACLIRRAAFTRAFGEDATPYFIQDLTAQELRSETADGQDIRAVRMAAQRVVDDPGLADYLVIKPGPLPGEHEEYAELYRRGMGELWTLVSTARTRGRY